MTVECLKEALLLTDNYFGKQLSTEERSARARVYAAALKDIPDDIALQGLTAALKVCRYQNQLLVDWCSEIRRIQSAALPSASTLWHDALVAARKIERNRYYMTHGGLVTVTGKLTAEDFKAENQNIFAELPASVREWAGSPDELVDKLNQDQAELLRFVRPSFDRAVNAAADITTQTSGLPGGASIRVEIGDKQPPTGRWKDYPR